MKGQVQESINCYTQFPVKLEVTDDPGSVNPKCPVKLEVIGDPEPRFINSTELFVPVKLNFMENCDQHSVQREDVGDSGSINCDTDCVVELEMMEDHGPGPINCVTVKVESLPEHNNISPEAEFDLLTKHKNSDKRFNCETCGRSLSDKSTLTRHIRTHTGERPFNCKTCGKSYSHKNLLTYHIKTHPGDKPAMCHTLE